MPWDAHSGRTVVTSRASSPDGPESLGRGGEVGIAPTQRVPASRRHRSPRRRTRHSPVRCSVSATTSGQESPKRAGSKPSGWISGTQRPIVASSVATSGSSPSPRMLQGSSGIPDEVSTSAGRWDQGHAATGSRGRSPRNRRPHYLDDPSPRRLSCLRRCTLLLEDLRAVALDLAESLEFRVKKARRRDDGQSTHSFLEKEHTKRSQWVCRGSHRSAGCFRS